MTAIINILINATNNASKTIGTVNKDLGSTVQTMGQVAAAAGIAAFAVKEIFEIGKEGAILELNESRFIKLAESIGTTADALNEELSTAMRGMVTDAQQVELANQIMSLGLATTEEGVVRLARLITENGWDMRQVILTFANDSKMRLDALGLSVTDVEERQKKLVASGMSLTEAFDLAVIEAGEAKLNLVGSAADSSVGSFDRLTAAIGNQVDAGKKWLSEWTAPAADALVLLMTRTETLNDVFATHEKEVFAVSDKYADYKEEMDRAGEAAGKMVFTQEELDRKIASASLTTLQAENSVVVLSEAEFEQQKRVDALTKIYAAAGVELNQYSYQQAEATDGTLDFQGAITYVAAGLEMARDSVYDYTQGIADAEAETRRIEAAMNDLQLFVQGPLGNEFESFTQKQADLEAQAASLREEMAALGAAEFISPEQLAQIEPLQNELMGLLTQIYELDEAIEGGELNNKQELAAKASLEELRGEAYLLEESIRELGGLPYMTDDQAKELEEMRAEYAETNEAIAANAAAHDEATKRILFDLASQRAALDGLTSAELTVLNNLALQYGLIDQATADYAAAADKAFSDLADGESIVEVTAQLTAAGEAQLTTNTNLLKGVGAFADYQEKLLELEEPLTHNAELIGVVRDTAYDLNQQLNAIKGDYVANVYINTSGSVPNIQQTGANTGQGGTTATAKAGGGPVYPSEWYMVGEQGPELFKPNRAGAIIPADETASMMVGASGRGQTPARDSRPLVVQLVLDGRVLAQALVPHLGEQYKSAVKGGAKRGGG